VGSGRANQFGSCPKLPRWMKPTPLSLAHSFRPRSMAIILLSNSEAGRAILGDSFILFRLGIAWPTMGRGIWFPERQHRTKLPSEIGGSFAGGPRTVPRTALLHCREADQKRP